MAFLNDRLAPFHRVADPRSTYPQSLRQCPERYPRLPSVPNSTEGSWPLPSSADVPSRKPFSLPLKKKERRIKIEQIRSTLEVHPFNELAAAGYGVIRDQLEKKGVVISERDLQIASIAFSTGLCVITRNVREFSRVEALKVEDWVNF